MLLMLDNYDSFVFNLVRYCEELGEHVAVYRNDALSVEDVVRLRPDGILLSPGPGRPEDAGIMIDLITHLSGHVPILGVCLGHQAIGHAFGGRIIRANEPMHGRSSRISHDDSRPFTGLPQPLTVGRYHSLVIDPASLPSCLRITGHSESGEIMAIAHRQHPTYGVQFHPESILTEGGHQMLRTFLTLCGGRSHG